MWFVSHLTLYLRIFRCVCSRLPTVAYSDTTRNKVTNTTYVRQILQTPIQRPVGDSRACYLLISCQTKVCALLYRLLADSKNAATLK